MRRPSPALLISLLALFVALGGPAQAARLISGSAIKAGTIKGKQVKDGSLGAKELTAGARRTLTATPAGSVGAAHLLPAAIDGSKLATGSVDSAKLLDNSIASADIGANAVDSDEIAMGAVGYQEIRDNAIDSGEVIDNGLKAKDVGSFTGSLTVNLGGLGTGVCTTVTSAALPRPAADASLEDDVIAVTPATSFPPEVTWSAYAGGPDTLRVTVCNGTGGGLTLGDQTFRYVSFDVG